MKDFRGTGVAMVTPFKEDMSVDYEALERLTNHLIDGKVDYLVVQGTTGESVTLTEREKDEVLRTVVSVNRGRLPIVFGHGGNNTRQLIEAFSEMNLDGVDAILSASPAYNKPTQNGIIAHYKAFAAASPKPVILYNVPGRTASNMLPQTSLEVGKLKNVIAIKEAAGDLAQVGELVKHRKDFLIISGDDPLLLPHMAMGGDGIISVIANAFPLEFSELTRCCMLGDFNKARNLHYLLIDMIGLIFKEGNPAGIKAALHAQGLMLPVVRLPLVAASEELAARIEAETAKILKQSPTVLNA